MNTIPNIRILDQNFNLLAEIDRYSSLLYARHWQGVGEFEFHTIDAGQVDALKEGNFIMLENDGHRGGIIRSVQADRTESGISLTVKGQTLNGIASQRQTIPMEYGDEPSNPDDPDGPTVLERLNGGYDNIPPITSESAEIQPVAGETILKGYAGHHLTGEIDPKREIPHLTIVPDQERGGKTVWMTRYEQLDTVLQNVSEYTDIGWEIYFDLSDTPSLVFDVVPGVDRSSVQSAESRVMFSIDFENITSLTYAHDVLNWRNVAYAGGKGEGVDRLILKVPKEETEATGMNRFEVFIDCGELEVMESETALSLAEEAKHKLLDYEKVENLTATVEQSGSFRYRREWDLGDLVTVTDRTLGVAMEKRITQVTERYEAQNCGIDVQFGNTPANLDRVIRKIKNTVR